MSTKYKTINIVPVTFQFAALTMDVLEAAPNWRVIADLSGS